MCRSHKVVTFASCEGVVDIYQSKQFTKGTVPSLVKVHNRYALLARDTTDPPTVSSRGAIGGAGGATLTAPALLPLKNPDKLPTGAGPVVDKQFATRDPVAIRSRGPTGDGNLDLDGCKRKYGSDPKDNNGRKQ